jgi:hypothetical protein
MAVKPLPIDVGRRRGVPRLLRHCDMCGIGAFGDDIASSLCALLLPPPPHTHTHTHTHTHVYTCARVRVFVRARARVYVCAHVRVHTQVREGKATAGHGMRRSQPMSKNSNSFTFDRVRFTWPQVKAQMTALMPKRSPVPGPHQRPPLPSKKNAIAQQKRPLGLLGQTLPLPGTKVLRSFHP